MFNQPSACIFPCNTQVSLFCVVFFVLYFTKAWFRCVNEMITHGGKYVQVLPTMCNVIYEWRIVFFRIFERGVWWYYYRIVQTLDRWSDARGHCIRHLPWYPESHSYTEGLRVASMQSNGSNTIWWMLSGYVSINCHLCLCVVKKNK